MKKLLLMLCFLGIACFGYSQSTISGTILDENNEPLIGAAVFAKGTGKASITDIDGKFMISGLDAGSCDLEVSYLGYGTINQRVDLTDGNNNLETMIMAESGVGLESVVITGVMDIVQDRRTPVAVSTISGREIQAKGGNVEFPELMKSTPSIYVANQAGGYGDSEVFTRGFDQTNTAFLLNGQPINGMEDGKMYWSNWSGMSDIASAVQVQRGLGSSKLAISSVGGTTNIIMKATEAQQGGYVRYMLGNDNYHKATLNYNTGMINDKFGISLLLTHWQGDGWAEGTKGQGQNYFLSLGYKASDRSNFNFLITGAPQWHDQNFTKTINSHYQNGSEFNIKYNGNYGFRGGEYQTLRRNYYHKPVANLNWDFQINDASSLSSVLYASWGRGGGTGDRGNRDNRFFTDDGYYDWDQIVSANNATPDDPYIIRASANNHQWFGNVTKYENQLTENINLSVGADYRWYRGSHFRQVVDLLGGSQFGQGFWARFDNKVVTQTYEANPWKAISNYAGLEDRIHYSNDEIITYLGGFGQLEYSNDVISTYIQGAVSSQAHTRFEQRFETEADEESEKVTNPGYNIKGGISYSVNSNHMLFANAGFYSRQPFHDNIYLNFSNQVNPVTVNEKITGFEVGYKFTSEDFALNINGYNTSWKDRATTRSLDPGTILSNGIELLDEGFQNTLQNQTHTGVELDFGYEATEAITVKGFASVGSWKYNGTLDTKFYNQDRDLVLEETGEDVDAVRVGGAAQTSFGVGVDYEITKDLFFDVDYNYYDNLYSNIGVSTESLKLPSFGLLDLGVSYNFLLNNGQVLGLRANVFNALGEEYISRAWTAIAASGNEAENWNGVNRDNRVSFGKTTTWNLSLRYSF